MRSAVARHLLGLPDSPAKNRGHWDLSLVDVLTLEAAGHGCHSFGRLGGLGSKTSEQFMMK